MFFRKWLLCLTIVGVLMLPLKAFSHDLDDPVVIENKFEQLQNAGIVVQEGMTRARLAEILVQIYRLKAGRSRTGFADTQGHWAAEHIESVKQAGLMIGVGKEQFKPDESVTYEQLAVVLVRAMDLFMNGPGITDVNVSEWGRPYVASAVNDYFMKVSRGFDYTRAADLNTLIISLYSIYAKEKLESDIRDRARNLQ